MQTLLRLVAALVRSGKRAYARKWGFLGLFAFTFLSSVIVLNALDLLPDTSIAKTDVSTPSRVMQSTGVELPVHIDIAAIGLAATVANPVTTNVDVLDADLLKGAVRYPTSARLGEKGNVVLFGHSSYLPIVGNPAYKTFNGIQKLKAGDTIVVSSSGIAYSYRVRTVAKESANNAVIHLDVPGRVLTLSTCNSFATKTDRFVVTADFVESHALST